MGKMVELVRDIYRITFFEAGTPGKPRIRGRSRNRQAETARSAVNRWRSPSVSLAAISESEPLTSTL